MLEAKAIRAVAGLLLSTCGLLGLTGCAPGDESDPAARSGSAVWVEIEDLPPGPEAAWAPGTYALPEIMGPGVGLFDLEGDGDLDILQLRTPPPGSTSRPAPNRVLEQRPDGTFVDATAVSGLGDVGYGQTLAVGDVDNDGDEDVFIGNYGVDALYLNDGAGRFAVTPGAWEREGWTTAATFCDYDRDGWLDLYVARYLHVNYHEPCRSAAGAPDYCGPKAFRGQPDRLYRNRGDGRFDDVTEAVGLTPSDPARAKGLGVLCVDLTGDGWADFYVANDGEPNQLWVNRQDGTFRDESLMRGLAVNRQGQAEASMGIAFGDVDGDLAPDLLLTHLSLENNTLYRGGNGPVFADRTVESGLAEHDRPYTGFGCGLFDMDHDGRLDLAVVNGRVARAAGAAEPEPGRFWEAYAEPNLLFRGEGNGRFRPVPAEAGTFGSRREVSRGLALGDLDADGDLDLVLSNVGNSLRVYRNEAPAQGTHWLLVRAVTRERHALGAEITLISGSTRRRSVVAASYGYQSSHDPRAHFGLGAIDHVELAEVRWPDGQLERFEVGPVNREIELVQGKGLAP